MNHLLLYLFAILGLILQSTLFGHLSIAGVKPDLILILAVFYSMFQGPKRGALFGFSLGLLEDIYIGRFLGMNALAKGITSLVLGWVTVGAFRENLLVPLLTLFIGTLINEFVFLIIGNIQGLNWAWDLLLWKGIPVAVYNTCLVPLVYSRFYFWVTRAQEKHVL